MHDGGRATLGDLGQGESAVVVAVEGEGPIARRLGDLGFLPGTPVTLVRRAPLGDPGLYALRGTHFCLRRAEAERVRVRRG